MIPREILYDIREGMKNKSLPKAISIIAQRLHLGSGDYKRFSHSINGHKWRGIIYYKRNSLLGTIFSYFDSKPLVIKGYPKIRYSEVSRVRDKECYLEAKYDGTNLGFWMFPDGTLMGKTRFVERYDRPGYEGRRWSELISDTGYMDQIAKLCKDDYSPFGELYGYRNPGEFIRYSTPIDIKFFEVCDLRTMEWIEYNRKIKLLESYGLRPVELYWHGVLSLKEIARLEYEAKQYVCLDGMEGYVAKWYSSEDRETYMAKLKCDDIKERAWGLSPRSTIPRSVISKAVKKALDNRSSFSTLKEVEDFVREELLEEATKELVNRVDKKIKRIVKGAFGNIEDQKKIWDYFEELESMGVSIDNKNKILSLAASVFKDINPSELYRAYCGYLAIREIRR